MSVNKNLQLEDYVDMVDYHYMNTEYTPTKEALEFVTFIKMVNGVKGEENKTPVMHLMMLDDLIHKNDNLFVVHRGGAKLESASSRILTPKGWTTMGEIQAGDKVITKKGTIAEVSLKTEPMYPKMFEMELSDGTVLTLGDEHNNVVIGRKRNSEGKLVNYDKVMTTQELFDKGLTYNTTRKNTKDGKAQYRFKIPLVEPIQFEESLLEVEPYTMGISIANAYFKSGEVSCHEDDRQELLTYLDGVISTKYAAGNCGKIRLGSGRFKPWADLTSRKKYIPHNYLFGSIEQRTELLRGLMDGDGSIAKNGACSYSTYSEQLASDVRDLIRSLGGIAYVTPKQRTNPTRVEYKVTCNIKINPFKLKRKADKWKPTKKISKVIVRLEEVECKEEGYCIQVDSDCHTYINEGYTVTHNTTVVHEYAFLYMATYGEFFHWGPQSVCIYVSDTMENGVKNMRNQLEYRWRDSEFLQTYLPEAKFTDDSWEFTNLEGKKTFIKGFAAMTGVRGFKKYGQRPTWCGFDDLMSDKNAKSPTILADIENVIYKAAMEALHPSKRKIVWTGTPFSKADSLYKAAGSGAWNVRAFPLCEKFPCDREDFSGSWPDRFTYESTLENYTKKHQNGKLAAFNQELMLRITSEEDRLVLDSDIMWYSRNSLLHNKGNYNFYITTDFATSEKQSADYSVISVWAINNKGFWFLVDGICQRQTMDKNIDDLFRLAQLYRPKSVGVEVTGQQGGFIQWIQKEMMDRDIWFSLASENNNGNLGIRPVTKKLDRFQTVVPWFKAKRMFFPEEMRGTDPLVIEMEDELKFVSKEGFKSAHDDAADTVSMLTVMNAWRPSHDSKMAKSDESGVWADDFFGDDDDDEGIGSYVV